MMTTLAILVFCAGELASLVSDAVILPYRDIPGFPVSTAPGHQGQLVFGYLSGARVVLMQVRELFMVYLYRYINYT